jgi:hypothetical protein
MPFHLPPQSAREKMFWASVAVLAVGQLAAIWMLCSHQVRQAQARAATMQVERSALADCLRYIPGSTPHHCSARLATAHDPNAVLAAGENTAGLSASASVGRVAHVNFSLR